jgi:NAD(P)-dependent dehydrogenase (short-subunit alcohol dehydrogenase family)
LVDAVIARMGGLDLLVNNASVYHRAELRELTERAIAEELRVNLLVPMLLTRFLAARRDSGRIVNLLDRRIAANEAGCSAYLLSKKALAEFTRSAAVELGPGFTVNGVAPGPILPPPGLGEDYLAERGGRILLETRPGPDAVADAVRFLLEADCITGQILYVDSGQHLLGAGV